jgi:hypothetical protein
VEEICVLAVSRYSFTEDGTNRLVQGCRVTYMIDFFEDEPDRKGYQVMEVAGDYSLFGQAKVVPGFYRAQFSQRMDRRTRKVVVQLVSLSYLRPFDVDVAFEGGNAVAAD